MATTTTAMSSKMEPATPSATPTPTPSPTKASEPVAVAPKPARRAIRTYGKKRPLLEDSNKGNVLPLSSIASQPAKRQKVTAVAELDVDEISRQLLKEAEEAEEAERRSRERPKTPRKTSPPRADPPPQKAGGSPRKQGIMRYFQPAAPRSAAAAQPQPVSLALPEPPCSPAGSVSSMSSLSSCPSPTSSMGSFLSRESSVEPLPSAAVASVADTIVSDTLKDDSSPPPSPLWRAAEQRPRQKRRLTIRPDGHLPTSTPDETVNVSGERQSIDETEVMEKNSTSTDRADGVAITTATITKTTISSMMATSSSRMRLQLGLSKTALTAPVSDKKRKKAASVASVQTTLSLAIAGGDSASVKECRECNILYNPLHEKDARFHARYHASVCRKQHK
ncbi:MAG: hypothetical protein STHCBS139747_000476 [Sporothrix thermara]